MKKRVFIFAAILVIAIIGIVCYVVFSHQNADTEYSSEAEEYSTVETSVENDTEAEVYTTEETTAENETEAEVYSTAEAAVENDTEENILNAAKGEETVSVESFNSRLNSYYGKGLSGTEVNSMLDLLISNAESYSGKAEYLPTVRYADMDGNTVIVEGQDSAAQNGESYIENLTQLKRQMDASNSIYATEMFYADSGLVNEIWIFNY